MPEPIPSRLVHPGLPGFVRRHPRGRIRIHPGVSKARVVAGIAAAYPSARCLVLFSKREDAEKFRSALTKAAPELANRVNKVEEPGEICCGLWFHAAEVDFYNYDCVFVPQAKSILCRCGRYAMHQNFARFRPFGIEHAEEHRTEREDALLMSAYGPADFEIPADGAESAHVQFAWLDSNPPPLPRHLQGVELHRYGYWRHPIRNRRIAKLAVALNRGDAESIRRRHPDVYRWLRSQERRPQHVVVHCGNLEQLVALQHHLPEARVSTRLTDEDLLELPRRLRERITVQQADGSGGIVLTDGDTACRRQDVDVIIWADGGPGILPGPFSSYLPSRRRVLLVDYRDRHHRRLDAWSQKRFRQYIEHGWYPTGTDEQTGRIERFLIEHHSHDIAEREPVEHLAEGERA